MRRAALLALAAALCGCISTQDRLQEIVVLAPASLTDVLDDLAQEYEEHHAGQEVVLSIGATSMLARQVSQGAPADLFISAHDVWMEWLVAHNHVIGSVEPVIANRLVVAGSPDIPAFDDAEFMLNFKSIALADPSHVPAGLYAKHALECTGLWEAISANIVPSLDVRTALLSVETAAAEIAIVYASDVHAAERVTILMEWPDECAPDIRYTAASLNQGTNAEAAAAFLAFSRHPARQSTWQQHGFVTID